MDELSERIKEFRTRNGYSQEHLAELTGLNLRTIQRIEGGKTMPRGDSIRRLSTALNISPDDLVDWTLKKDRNVLILLSLSQLSLLIFPILGIIIPLIIWMLRKDKDNEVNRLGREILNFQITWTTLIILLTSPFLISVLHFEINLPAWIPFFGIIVSYGYNFLLIMFNTILVLRNKKTFYKPCIKIMKN